MARSRRGLVTPRWFNFNPSVKLLIAATTV
jgi:6-phosphogluconolactonase (cycloisomerase 2 family)